jgi:hypothetical protein
MAIASPTSTRIDAAHSNGPVELEPVGGKAAVVVGPAAATVIVTLAVAGQAPVDVAVAV